MVLPADIEKDVWQTVQTIEQEKQMPYLTPLEEIWLEDGKKQGIAEGKASGIAEGEARSRASLEKGIERSLQLKFGPEAAASLMPEIRSVALPRLYDTLSLIVEAETPAELRRLLANA